MSTKRHKYRLHSLTKEKVIVGLQQGKSANQILRECNASRTPLNQWLKHDPTFAKEYYALQEERKKSSTEKVAEAEVNSQFAPWWEETDTWKYAFFKAYKETRDRNTAAEVAKVPLSHIANILNPEHDLYDPKFFQWMLDEKLSEAWQAEDDIKKKALNEGNITMLRYFHESLKGDDKNQSVENQNNFFFLSNEGIQAAIDALSRISRPEPGPEVEIRGLPETGSGTSREP